ncbi:Protein N-acetyltransferase [Fructobacillus fructosus]|uniref:GNAT family N-acetyltransferase n=1 Tax=Fructobacillus fructosus TaxID=1631 RepID=UPI002DB15A91|nr:Protein N-acetyltransferase [Fructobacillus fructosus]
MIEFTTKVGRVQVLPIQTKYAAAIYQKIAEGREEIGRFLPWPKGLTLRDEKDFLYQEKNRTYRKHPLVFTMTVNSQPVGMIDLHELDEQKKTAELGYWLAVDYQRQGITSQATKSILHYAYKTLGLEKVRVCIHPKNVASQRVATRNHFQVIGQKKELTCFEHPGPAFL